ncbi:MAG TPA: alpha/beta hydrolase [Microlunatus sp.]
MNLLERWTEIGGVPLFYRESEDTADRPAMVHVAGFGLSGSYLVPTAERLAGTFHTLVPDLPGSGRSGRPQPPLGMEGLADALAAFLDDRGVDKATMVGNSMGCAVICEFAFRHRERIDRAVLVSPAGGIHNQPLPRAMRQLAVDGVREPVRLFPVVVPDYLRYGIRRTVDMFRTLTRFPALDRMLALDVPTLAVVGQRDPLMPGAARLVEIAAQTENHVLMVVIDTAAHAINFTHPDELAHAIGLFMADQPIVDDPDAPGVATAYEIHRGIRLPPAAL